MSLVYALIYLLFEAYPIIFSEVHDLKPGYSSLPFLSTLVGAIVSGELRIYLRRETLLTRCSHPQCPSRSTFNDVTFER